MKITFKNRYGDDVTFVKLEQNKWLFRVDNELPWSFAGEPNNYIMADPSGGPCLVVGSNFLDTAEKIISIKHEPYFVDGHGFEYFGYIVYTGS